MIEKRTTIEQIEITEAGYIQIRFAILLLEDGVEINRKWHRTVIEPGVDVDAQLAAVDADITARPELRAAPVDRARAPLLKSICGLVHTASLINAHQARMSVLAEREASHK
jgi:hypothetical protein